MSRLVFMQYTLVIADLQVSEVLCHHFYLLGCRTVQRGLDMQVSLEDFESFALMRQSVHRLAMALDFFFSTEGKICKEDFERAVAKVLGHGLPTTLVSHCSRQAGRMHQVGLLTVPDVTLACSPRTYQTAPSRLSHDSPSAHCAGRYCIWRLCHRGWSAQVQRPAILHAQARRQHDLC